ncbi:hypothetical protein [Streptomyces sp. NPDC001165]|uniref:hypothetical protein n=1 Tax=Streptomyces sp. NPDC001165 TaxID=3364546 RepID=UPI0036923B06
MNIANPHVWRVQKWDQTLCTYSNLDAAKDHGEYVVHAHYQDAMDRRRVPETYRAIDWRVWCCGHLYGPGQFNHTAYPETHADGCLHGKSEVLGLRPFWAVSGARAGGNGTRSDWEIWQTLAFDRFEPSMAM